MPDRPNILWICTDQHRYDALGPYDTAVETPALDKFADDGVRFDRTYCQSPVCTPSRASFLTGRYPRTTGCRQNGQPMARDEHLVTATLAAAGYRCGLAGKLHLSPTNPDDPTDALGREPARRLRDGYGTFHWSPDPGDEHPDNAYQQWLTGRDVSFEHTPYQDSAYVESGMASEHHQTKWCTDRAIDYVEAAAGDDSPWLFSLNYFDPHHPFDPPPAYLERALDRIDDELPDRNSGELAEKPAVQREASETGSYPGATMTDEDHRLIRAAYYAMVEFVDDQIQRLLDALEATDQREETLVVFMADHGEMLGDHDMYKKGPYFYEPAVRVPLLVSWPGWVDTGVVRDDIVELVDLAPTLLDAADVTAPPGIQGASLWPLLTGESDTHTRASAYCAFYNASKRHTNPPAYATMLRTDEHKLVVHHGTDDGELYDLETDPAEYHNRWADDDYGDIRAALLERLTDRMAQTIDPLPERGGSW